MTYNKCVATYSWTQCLT